MGEAGRGRVRALFAPATMCAMINDTYERLLGTDMTPRLAA
jgi:hypothetical protein